jgi:hypothetical protein
MYETSKIQILAGVHHRLRRRTIPIAQNYPPPAHNKEERAARMTFSVETQTCLHLSLPLLFLRLHLSLLFLLSFPQGNLLFIFRLV